MENKKVVGIGEVLWDVFPEGKQLGGAPANFVWHTMQMGAQGTVVSAVWNDQYGQEILDILQERKLEKGIVMNDKPTGTVEVTLKEGIPEYIIHEQVSWDFIDLNDYAVEVLTKADAVCFGSLARRSEYSRAAIDRAVEMTPDGCLKVFDVNLRQHYYGQKDIEYSLAQSDVFKLNDEELMVMKKFWDLPVDDIEACQKMLSQFHLQMVVLTSGDQRSVLVTSHQVSEMQTPKVRVRDTVGAGDAFTAAVTMGILEKRSLQKIHQEAVEVAAFVCTKTGAMPELDG